MSTPNLVLGDSLSPYSIRATSCLPRNAFYSRRLNLWIRMLLPSTSPVNKKFVKIPPPLPLFKSKSCCTISGYIPPCRRTSMTSTSADFPVSPSIISVSATEGAHRPGLLETVRERLRLKGRRMLSIRHTAQYGFAYCSLRYAPYRAFKERPRKPRFF
jgi:hypothetical protein